MPTYVYPEMPLLANVWWAAPQLPPGAAADEVVSCSLSPIRPEQFWTDMYLMNSLEFYPTHIIRTPTNPFLGENMVARETTFTFPASVFEYPRASAHFYLAVWAHIVGKGFSNEHHRVYVARWTRGIITGPDPLFKGWT